MKKTWGKVLAFAVTVTMATTPTAYAFGLESESSDVEAVEETVSESVDEMKETLEIETMVNAEETEINSEKNDTEQEEKEKTIENLVTTTDDDMDVDDSAEENDEKSDSGDDVETGFCGENTSYVLNVTTGVLIISGTGEMNDYFSESTPFGENATIKEIIIESGVTGIGTCAFINCCNLRRITLPDGLIHIGDNAFLNCTQLEYLDLPNGLISIGTDAFNNCCSLNSIVIPESVTSIGEGAFYNCKVLSSIVLHSKTAFMGSYAFGNCNLTSIVFPDGTEKVYGWAFSRNNNLDEVYIPVSVQEIYEGTFNGCTVYYGGTFSQWRTIDFLSGASFWSTINYGEGFILSSYTITLSTNHNIQLIYKAIPSELAGKVTWTSSNPKVASVDSKGNITALTYGKSTITATVKIDGTTYKKTCTVQTRYYDVADSSKYYFKPVYWAADKGITSGYGNVYFGTDENCTREQLITFMYRQAGKPSVTAADIKKYSFPDVASGAYYEKAVVWAAKKGITKGYSSGEYAGKFGVGLPVTREDTVTFIYRMAGKPAVSNADLRGYSFPDEVSGAYYCKPIAWAAKNGITKGYTSGEYAGMFGVGLNVLRQDIVTFLYRYARL